MENDVAQPLIGDHEVQIHSEEGPAQQLLVQGTQHMHIPLAARTC